VLLVDSIVAKIEKKSGTCHAFWYIIKEKPRCFTHQGSQRVQFNHENLPFYRVYFNFWNDGEEDGITAIPTMMGDNI